MKTIGILGGMGPLATVDIFKKIVMMTDAHSDNEHIPVLIDNNTKIPDRTSYILGKGGSPLNELVRSAVRLETMGADVIIIACNTAHYFYDDIVKHVKIPVINMIEETAKEIRNNRPDVKQVGLLATEGTCKAGVYKKVFERFGIGLIQPDTEDLKQIMDVIYGIKQGLRDIDPTGFKQALSNLKLRGAETLILGCTEIPIAFQMFNISDDFVDASEVLVKRAITFAGKNVKA
ncbi:MAG: aspartate/glutamate racemase family protein [Caulobacteraceae bacterium]